jgi:hypothetical protein
MEPEQFHFLFIPPAILVGAWYTTLLYLVSYASIASLRSFLFKSVALMEENFPCPPTIIYHSVFTMIVSYNGFK